MVDLNFQLLSAYIAHIFPCLDHQSQDALAPEASQDIFLALSWLALSITWPSRCIKIGQPVMSLTFSRDNQLLIVPSAFCISNISPQGSISIIAIGARTVRAIRRHTTINNQTDGDTSLP
jgi:hypothetical protein